MKELLVVLLVLVVTASGAPQYNQATYSSGPQKFVRDQYGQYHPVSGPPVGPPFGSPFRPGGGRPPHAAASLIHGQSGFQQFPSHQNQFQQGFPSFQQGFPSHQNQFPSQFPPQTGVGGDVPIIPLPPNPNRPNRPSVIPGGNTQVGSDIDISQFARNRPGAGTEIKKEARR